MYDTPPSVRFSSLDLSSNRVWGSLWSFHGGSLTLSWLGLKMLSLLYVFLTVCWLVCACSGLLDTSFGFTGESILLWAPRVLEGLLLPFLYESLHQRSKHRLLSPLSYNSGHIKPAGRASVMLADAMDYAHRLCMASSIVLLLSSAGLSVRLKDVSSHAVLAADAAEMICDGSRGHLDAAGLFDFYLSQLSLMLLLYTAVSWNFAGERRSMVIARRVCATSGLLFACPLHLIGGIVLCSGGAKKGFMLLALAFLFKSLLCFSFSLLPPPPRLPAERLRAPNALYHPIHLPQGVATTRSEALHAALPPPTRIHPPVPVEIAPPLPYHHHHHHHNHHHHIATAEKSDDESELSSTVLISEMSHRNSFEQEEEKDADVEIKSKTHNLIGLPALHLHKKLESSTGEQELLLNGGKTLQGENLQFTSKLMRSQLPSCPRTVKAPPSLLVEIDFSGKM
mmetsp:Transcript_30066/g.96666  ORF Transcript_30066/g.96666 Transcript_30066/m.96666 type:complete len:452 (+) Transcript_30066:308-1663(+)